MGVHTQAVQLKIGFAGATPTRLFSAAGENLGGFITVSSIFF